jgi:predicted nuclease of predicted toxin-antitoxin system
LKILLDENLSPRLVELLSDLYPGSAHVHQCGLGSSDDSTIWDYARTNGFTIVSKDSDFEERSILLGCPPKVILLRASNCTSKEIAVLLRTAFSQIDHFIREREETCLVLGLQRKSI